MLLRAVLLLVAVYTIIIPVAVRLLLAVNAASSLCSSACCGSSGFCTYYFCLRASSACDAEPRHRPCRPRAPYSVGDRSVVRVKCGVGLIWADVQD